MTCPTVVYFSLAEINKEMRFDFFLKKMQFLISVDILSGTLHICCTHVVRSLLFDITHHLHFESN